MYSKAHIYLRSLINILKTKNFSHHPRTLIKPPSFIGFNLGEESFAIGTHTDHRYKINGNLFSVFRILGTQCHEQCSILLTFKQIIGTSTFVSFFLLFLTLKVIQLNIKDIQALCRNLEILVAVLET